MEMEQMVTRKCPSPMCNHILFPYCYSFTSISGQHTYTHISNSTTNNYCKYIYFLVNHYILCPNIIHVSSILTSMYKINICLSPWWPILMMLTTKIGLKTVLCSCIDVTTWYIEHVIHLWYIHICLLALPIIVFFWLSNEMIVWLCHVNRDVAINRVQHYKHIIQNTIHTNRHIVCSSRLTGKHSRKKKRHSQQTTLFLIFHLYIFFL